jgi:hypothetical protein
LSFYSTKLVVGHSSKIDVNVFLDIFGTFWNTYKYIQFTSLDGLGGSAFPPPVPLPPKEDERRIAVFGTAATASSLSLYRSSVSSLLLSSEFPKEKMNMTKLRHRTQKQNTAINHLPRF